MPPARPAPASATQLPIRPIVINKPIERIIEHSYREGYRERIVERPGRDTGPIQQIVLPPVQQRPERPLIVNVASPTSPSKERIISDDQRQPPRSDPWPQKERDGYYRPTPSQIRTNHPPTVQQGSDTPTDPSRTQPDHPGQPVKNGPDPEQKQFAEPNTKSSPINSETIPNNSGNNSPTELIEPDQPASKATLPGFKKVGKVGRQRRYDELGISDIEPIKEVFLLRHLTGKPWPGLSEDMEAYYEKFYFSKPKRGTKDYAKHVKCWERRTRWLAEHTGKATSV